MCPAIMAVKALKSGGTASFGFVWVVWVSTGGIAWIEQESHHAVSAGLTGRLAAAVLHPVSDVVRFPTPDSVDSVGPQQKELSVD